MYRSAAGSTAGSYVGSTAGSNVGSKAGSKRVTAEPSTATAATMEEEEAPKRDASSPKVSAAPSCAEEVSAGTGEEEGEVDFGHEEAVEEEEEPQVLQEADAPPAPAPAGGQEEVDSEPEPELELATGPMTAYKVCAHVCGVLLWICVQLPPTQCFGACCEGGV